MTTKSDKHVGEKHGKLKIIALSNKLPNGYLFYYWCRCDCGNIKRYRYDQARRTQNCGMCQDFIESEVSMALEVFANEKD